MPLNYNSILKPKIRTKQEKFITKPLSDQLQLQYIKGILYTIWQGMMTFTECKPRPETTACAMRNTMKFGSDVSLTVYVLLMLSWFVTLYIRPCIYRNIS